MFNSRFDVILLRKSLLGLIFGVYNYIPIYPRRYAPADGAFSVKNSCRNAMRFPSPFYFVQKHTKCRKCLDSATFSRPQSSPCEHIGVGDGGRGARVPENSGKCFSGNYFVKFGHFRAKII